MGLLMFREIVIASLTARANAVKMLHARIQLLKAYLTSLPPSYLTTTTTDDDEPPSDPTTPPPDTAISELNHPLLRSTLALLSRLPLLLPPEHHSTFRQETLAEKSDVGLVALLGALGKSVKEAREMGRKFGVVEGVLKGKGKSGFPIIGGAIDDVWGQGLSGDGGLGGGSNGEGLSMDGGYVI